MSFSTKPGIVQDGLILSIDPGNRRSLNDSENLIQDSVYVSPEWGLPNGGATITTGIDAPDGSNDAIRYTADGTASHLFRAGGMSEPVNGRDFYTISFYARLISLEANATLSADWSDGAPSGSYHNQLVTGQWVRVELTGKPAETTKTFVDLIGNSGVQVTIDFWGLQVEKKDYASPYVRVINDAALNMSDKIINMAPSSRKPAKLTELTVTKDGGGSFNFIDPDLITLPASPGILLPEEYKIDRGSGAIYCWAKVDNFAVPSDHSNKGRVLVGRSSDGFKSQISFFEGGFGFESNTNSNPTELSGDAVPAYPAPAITAGSWFNFLLSFDNGQFFAYVNGEQVANGPMIDDLSLNLIGNADRMPTSYPSPFVGHLGPFALYNKPISASEAKSSYEALRRRFGL